MFTSIAQLARNSGGKELTRPDYLQALVDEFQTTEHAVHRHDVLCHLCNFSYDPINFHHLNLLNVFDLFLDVLCESQSSELVKAARRGLCNMSADPMFAESLIEEGGEGIRILFDDLGRVDSSARLETLAALYCALSASDNVLNFVRGYFMGVTDAGTMPEAEEASAMPQAHRHLRQIQDLAGSSADSPSSAAADRQVQHMARLVLELFQPSQAAVSPGT